MRVQLIGSSTYHNMYGLIDDEGHTVGTKEVQLMTGVVHYTAWAKGYTTAQVQQEFKAAATQHTETDIHSP